MTRQGYIVAGYKGGLELDIEHIHPDIKWTHSNNKIPLNKPLIRIIYNLIELFLARKHGLIISCGGISELCSALFYAIFRECSIFVPGVPPRFYPLVGSLMKIIKKTTIIKTCDVEFSERFPMAKLYKNNPFRNGCKKPDASNKKFDIILVGRSDENKQFQKLVNKISSCAKLNAMNLTIAHLGTGRISSSGNVKLLQFGFIKEEKAIIEFIKQSRILCISSIYESSPRVFWESTHSGTPVAATRCGNLRYFSAVAASANLEDLTRRIYQLLIRSDQELAELAAIQYAEAESFFSKRCHE